MTESERQQNFEETEQLLQPALENFKANPNKENTEQLEDVMLLYQLFF